MNYFRYKGNLRKDKTRHSWTLPNFLSSVLKLSGGSLYALLICENVFDMIFQVGFLLMLAQIKMNWIRRVLMTRTLLLIYFSEMKFSHIFGQVFCSDNNNTDLQKNLKKSCSFTFLQNILFFAVVRIGGNNIMSCYYYK